MMKIYITIFQLSNVQITQAEVNNVVDGLCNFGLCGLAHPMAFVISVRARVVAGQPLPIPHVMQELPPAHRAECAECAEFACVLAAVVYTHTRQGKQWVSKFCHKETPAPYQMHNLAHHT